MARWTINNWNAMLDNSTRKQVLGANGIFYEYIIPYGKNPDKFYEEAIDVRSHKSPTTKYNNGKKPGQYQPIGDKNYFTFYQLKQMRKRGEDEDYIKEITEIINKFYEGLQRGLNNV